MWFSGYVDAPEKTAERFSKDGRWYLTGHDHERGETRSYRLDRIEGDVIPGTRVT